MSSMAPIEMANRLGSGLLSFPVTHFDADLRFDEGPYREHCAWLLELRALAGLFAAGGTGEFFSLTPAEVGEVVRAAVAETRRADPGDRRLRLWHRDRDGACAVTAEAAGADGILLLPPYLVDAQPGRSDRPRRSGVQGHSAGVIVYNRDNAILDDESLARLCERNPNLVGFKDGVGDIELMMRVYARMGDRLTYVGGLPTAETFALPYLADGRHHLFLGDLQLHAGMGAGLLRRGARRRPRDRHEGARGIRAALYRASQPGARLCGLHRQGRAERHRPPSRLRCARR